MNHFQNTVMGEIKMKKTVKLLAIASSFAFLANVANADTFIKMVSGPSGGPWGLKSQ